MAHAALPLTTRWRAWLFALACTVALSCSAAERWLHGSSPNFEMLSLASEKESRRVLTDLERFRENVLGFFPARLGREPRVIVYLFPSERSFRPYRPLYRGKPREVAGYFIHSQDEVVIALCTDNFFDEFEQPTEIVFHEYVHLLAHTRGLQLPVWLDEGLADVFSTFQVDGKFARYGEPKELYVALLQNTALLPVRKLFDVTHDSPDYNEEMRATTFYAQSWAFTHFLMCGGDGRNMDQLTRYINALEKPGATALGAFTDIFGADLKKLDAQLRSYLDGGSYVQRRLPLRDIDPAKIAFRPATNFERELGIVNLKYRVHRAADSEHRLLQLAAQHPQSPRPLELLALIAGAERKAVQALDYWQRAAALKSENAFVYVQLARMELLPFRPEDFDARLAPERAFELQRWLDRVLMLRPGYADAVEALAQVEARAPTLRIHGVNEVQKLAQGLRPSSATLLALAMIRWRAGDTATCVNIADAVSGMARARPEEKVAARLLKVRATGAASAPEAARPSAMPPRVSPFGITGGSLLETARAPKRDHDDNDAPPRTFIDELGLKK